MPRYLPQTKKDVQEMLAVVGANEVGELFQDIPKSIRLSRMLNLPSPLSEHELLRFTRDLASKNSNLNDYVSFLGAGAYDHFVPVVIDHLISRQEFYTAYTPYQPEISQGTLQSIFEFQTMMSELTGMYATNASMYDESTAVAEAALMACNVRRKNEVIVARNLHPESRKVLNTYARFRGITVKEVGYKDGQVDLEDLESSISKDTAAVIVQSPNFFGVIESLRDISEVAKKTKSLLIVSADPTSLAILESPGKQGADIVVGNGQPLGNSLSFGGPYFGYFSTTKKLIRKIPGRIVGQTVDKNGTRGYVLTLQAREQHIRREKATSNICSNHSLNALMAAIYLSVMGKQGLQDVAMQTAQKAHYAFKQLTDRDQFAKVFSTPFYREFVIRSEEPVAQLNERLFAKGILGGYDLSKDYPELEDHWLVAVTEKRTKAEIDSLVTLAGGEN